jgi:hypothetical protein
MISSKRPKVRIESPNCACGYVGHMTVDELKERAVHDDVDLACPVCGLIHLSCEEIKAAEKVKITESERYKQIQSEALANE